MKAFKLYCFIFIIIGVAFYADYTLLNRVKCFYIHRSTEQYPFLRELYNYNGYFSCDYNPICNITVKGLMTDHINFYLLEPAANLINNFLHLDELQNGFINIATLISITHAFVGIVAGFFIASSKLKFRRIGVVLFELRTLMDNLDGIVARKAFKIYGDYSDAQSIGFYIDGMCDLISIIWLLIVIDAFMTETSYMKLPVFSRYNQTHTQKLKNRILVDVLVTACILFFSGAAWNRYIILFEEKFFIYDMDFMRSSLFLLNAWMWRFFSVHALLHYLMIAIFSNKLTSFIKNAQIAILCSVVYVTIFSEVLARFTFPS